MSNPGQRKLSHVVLVVLGAALLLAGIWYGLLDGPRMKLSFMVRARKDATEKLDKLRRSVAEAAKSKAAIDAANLKLEQIESRMPVGDPYRWLVTALADFPATTNVSLANIEPPHVSETTLLPKVPYRTASFTLTGMAYYHQFGVFLAALENHFPHMRVKKLDLNPVFPGQADSPEGERLNFQLEVMVLFKPAAAAPPAQLSLRATGEKRN